MVTSPLITVMVNAVRRSTRGLMRDFGEVENLQVLQKGPADFVTKADRRVEEILFEELKKARPRFGFHMEEGGDVVGEDPDSRWIIDPIDGTTNFVHGIPHFGISVALEQRGELVAGVIYNPATNELFTGEKGRGSFLDDRRLRVSGRDDIEDAVVASGVPHRARADHEQFRKELAVVQEKVSGIRRFGAASLDLAYVACGRFDGYWERGLSSWDIAAGVVIVREANGVVGGMDGEDDFMKTGDIIVGNRMIYAALKEILVQA
jgi:myo-inositol-1(or 4)-monophosphatase